MPYIDGVYHATPLIASHPGEEIEEGDFTTASSSPSVPRASQRRRRILAKEVDEEEEEELTMPHLQGQGSQAAAESSVSGVLAGETSSQLDTGSNLKGAPSTAMVGLLVSVLELRHTPCLLTSLGSVVTQVELDKLHHRFHILHSISIRDPEMGELPLRAHKELGKITFLIITLEYEVRLLLAPFVKRLLNEFPLYPL